MPPPVDVLIEDERWRALDLEMLAQDAARATFAVLELPADRFEISLLACDDARIATLNEGFRGRAAATNVLSWPSAERGARRDGDRPDLPAPAPDGAMPAELGDIAISFETCEAEARAAGLALRDHVAHLLVHGVLHLMGFDHMRDGDATLMESLEIRILAHLHVANPYVVQSA